MLRVVADLRGGRRHRDSDDAAPFDRLSQKSRSPDVIDELIDSLEIFLIPLGHDDGLLDAVQVILQQTQTRCVSQGFGQSLAICAKGIPQSASTPWVPSVPAGSAISTSWACFSVRAR